MAQRITRAWQDPIGSYNSNEHNFTQTSPGRIFGFNNFTQTGITATILTIAVGHNGTTTLVKSKSDNTLEAPLGVHLTKNGSMVIEDAAISTAIPIDFTATERKRFWLVANHSWNEVPGGSGCLYTIIAGAGSITDDYIDPVLTTPEDQTVLVQFDVPTTAEGRTFANVVKTTIMQFSGGRDKEAMVSDLGLFPLYKSYKAIVSQSGTNDPVVIVLPGNTIGDIVWTRAGIGSFTGTLIGAFTTNKTLFKIGTGDNPARSMNIDLNTQDIIKYRSTTTTTGASSDVYNEVVIEIEVYY